MRQLALVGLLSVLGAGPAFAWGDEGHQIVCQIAFDQAIGQDGIKDVEVVMDLKSILVVAAPSGNHDDDIVVLPLKNRRTDQRGRPLSGIPVISKPFSYAEKKILITAYLLTPDPYAGEVGNPKRNNWANIKDPKRDRESKRAKEPTMIVCSPQLDPDSKDYPIRNLSGSCTDMPGTSGMFAINAEGGKLFVQALFPRGNNPDRNGKPFKLDEPDQNCVYGFMFEPKAVSQIDQYLNYQQEAAPR